MIPENFLILIEKLKEKTTAKQVIWTKTSRENQFKINLDKGSITIDSWEDEENYTSYVDMVIYNDVGDKIDAIYIDAERKEDYQNLAELHTMASRLYYKVDETFKSIFKELDSDKIIGKEDEELPSRDDMPF